MKISMLSQDQVDAEKLAKDKAMEISTLEAYLSSTDWYATRLAETGKAIPVEIVTNRENARTKISELRSDGVILA